MAVYTHLGAEALAALIAEFDVGTLVSAKGIAEGVSNSNWLIDTSVSRFILTVYEERTEAADLPFFLGLLDHLADRGCWTPAERKGWPPSTPASAIWSPARGQPWHANGRRICPAASSTPTCSPTMC